MLVESVGVFRVSGSDKRINSLISKFDAGPEYGKSISFEGYNVFDVADCLKKYFRTLPEPLLTTHLYPFWLHIPDEAQKAKSLQLLCFLLPKAHLISFEYLISLLKFTSTFEKNQMDMSNLSKIFAPSIMWPKAPQVQSKQDYEQSALLIELFAKHSQKLEMTAPSVVPYQVLDLPI
ncbi:Rho GTPase activation protein [Gorgonomyces haynaldii]|nr:Rho GTPase activation protein [Gorgonomyces haynaldii]